MKKIVPLCGIIALFALSCKKDDSNSHSQRQNELEMADPALKNSMLTFVANGFDLKVVKEIHQSISKTNEIGLDEISYAKELLSVEKKKFNGAPVAKTIIGSFHKGNLGMPSVMSRMGNPIEESEPDKPIIIVDDWPVDFDYLSPAEIIANDITFYWPNHENWDEVTIPLVALVSDEEVVTAYKQEMRADGTIRLIPVLMTEEDAETIPIMIIGNEEISYEEVTDENVIIINPENPSAEVPPVAPPVTPPVATGRDIYTLYLGKFRATNFHEPWTRGGPEWRFHFAGTQDFEIKTAADTIRFKNLTSTVKYIMDLSRKEAKKQLWYDFGISKPLLTTWSPELVFGHFLILEEDPGNFGPFKVTLGLKHGDNSFNVEANFSIKSDDDKVVNMSLHKDFLLSTGNGFHNKNWTVFQSGGVQYTLPMIKNAVYQ